jgi:lipopolysaccharide/colanic/teichoic acid biosynthesis glycosyltransferase
MASTGWYGAAGSLNKIPKMTSGNQLTIPDRTFDRDDTRVMFGVNLRIRRALNFTAAVIGLILFAPTLLVISIAIKLDSPGPIFIRKPQFGRGNQRIELFKFRFMSAGGDGNTRARLTRVGRILYGSGIDELPQLFNVLRGELSIIGPPPSPCSNPLLNKIKPGMIQWSQIVATRNRSGEDRKRLETYWLRF